MAAITPADLARELAAITRELEENRLTIIRTVINPDGTVVGEYRKTIRYPRDPQNSGPHHRGERS